MLPYTPNSSSYILAWAIISLISKLDPLWCFNIGRLLVCYFIYLVLPENAKKPFVAICSRLGVYFSYFDHTNILGIKITLVSQPSPSKPCHQPTPPHPCHPPSPQSEKKKLPLLPWFPPPPPPEFTLVFYVPRGFIRSAKYMYNRSTGAVWVCMG